MARFGDAEVVSGTRATAAEEATAARLGKRGPDLRATRRRAALILAGKRGLPVYESDYSRLVVQIAAPRDFADANGRQRNLPGIRAKFNFGLYTPVSVLRRGTKEHDEEVKIIVESMESHPKFGLNKLFWRADEMEKREKEIKYNEAVELLAADPELKDRFLASITSGELDASVMKTQGKRKGIIADARGREEFRPVPKKKTAEEELDDLVSEEKQETEEKRGRREIMERAERSRDALAQKARASADDDLSDVLTPRVKKKKKRDREESL